MESDDLKIKNQNFNLILNYKLWLVDLILFFSDTVSIFASFFIAESLRALLIPVLGGTVEINVLFPMVGMVFIIIIGLFIIKGLYPAAGRTGVVELKELIYLITAAYLVLGLAIFILGYGTQISRAAFIISYLFTLLFISSLRLLIHNRGSLRPWWAKPAVIIGTQQEVDKVVAHLIHARRMAYKPAIVLILDNMHQPLENQSIPSYHYSLANLQRVRQQGIQLAIFVSPNDESILLQKEVLNSLSVTFSQLLYVLGESPLSSLSLQTLDLEGHPVLQVYYHLMNQSTQRIKRLLDLVICIISLVITLPMLLIIAVLIHLDSPGPIFYVQNRIGKGGKQIKLYKFRTMEQNADQNLKDLLESNQNLRIEYEKYHKLNDDPRITRVGRFLRKVSLDEFPQIWNVIRGDMSLVGPRPYLPKEQSDIGDRLEIILRVVPGLTGWWQVMGRHDTTFDERINLDIYYISNFSIWLDFYIIIKTIWIVISGKGT